MGILPLLPLWTVNYQNSSSTEYNIVVDEPNKTREERYHIIDHPTTGTPFFCQLNLCISPVDTILEYDAEQKQSFDEALI